MGMSHDLAGMSHDLHHVSSSGDGLVAVCVQHLGSVHVLLDGCEWHP